MSLFSNLTFIISYGTSRTAALAGIPHIQTYIGVTALPTTGDAHIGRIMLKFRPVLLRRACLIVFIVSLITLIVIGVVVVILDMAEFLEWRILEVARSVIIKPFVGAPIESLARTMVEGLVGVESLIEFLIGILRGALTEALIESLIGFLIDPLVEALIGVMIGILMVPFGSPMSSIRTSTATTAPSVGVWSRVLTGT